jgi:hypothetical protein
MELFMPNRVTQCEYHPNDKHEENDHGCFAIVGDMVECLNPMGERLGIYGLVQSEEHRPSIRGPKRILNVYMNWDDGPSLEPYQDAFLRIVSRG